MREGHRSSDRPTAGRAERPPLLTAWQERAKLRAEAYKLWAKGAKLYAEGNKIRAEGKKLWAEGHKLDAEGKKLWADAVIAEYGPREVVDWSEYPACIVAGYKYEVTVDE